MEAARAVYRRRFDRTVPQKTRMRAWLATRQNALWASSRYSLAEFGLDTCSLCELFAPYMSTFDIDTQRDAEARSDSTA